MKTYHYKLYTNAKKGELDGQLDRFGKEQYGKDKPCACLGISPAPWYVRDNEFSDENEVWCDYVRDSGSQSRRIVATTNGNFKESGSDAAMIASAPDLYDALRSLVSLIDSGRMDLGCNAAALLDKARLALAKASCAKRQEGAPNGRRVS